MAILDLPIVSGIRYNADIMQKFKNMTFFFDPSWQSSDSQLVGGNTYPICLFYLKEIVEDLTSQVSQRQMLFYNSKATYTKTQQGVVADNIVNHPKKYRMEILIPKQFNKGIGGLFSVDNFKNSLSLLSQIKSTDSVFENINIGLGSVITLLTGIIGNVDAFISQTNGMDLSSLIRNLLTTENDYNKNSLEAMWRGRKIVKVKLLNSWTYKSCVINNATIKNIGQYKDFYEGSVTLQEIPIAEITKFNNIRLNENKGFNWSMNSIGDTMRKAFEALEV